MEKEDLEVNQAYKVLRMNVHYFENAKTSHIARYSAIHTYTQEE